MSAKEVIERLKRQESVELPGGDPLTPKQSILNATDIEAQQPEYRLRFVNLRDPEKVRSRKSEGYDFVPPEEGGRRLGDEYALMRLPRATYDARVKQIEKLNEQRLHQHEHEMQRIASEVARALRDNHGINVPVERLLVKES